MSIQLMNHPGANYQSYQQTLADTSLRIAKKDLLATSTYLWYWPRDDLNILILL